MHNKKELDLRMAAAGVRPLKSLGQNFLLNPLICKALVEAVAQNNPKTVVEIGPGLGALTDDLLQRSFNLKLIEMDAGLVQYWKQRVVESGTNPFARDIIHKDALRVDWQAIAQGQEMALVSNLPYSIAASLVIELSGLEPQPFVSLVLMFQKEVAERIESPLGGEDYGMLSVIAQSHWHVSRVIDAGPQDFYPVPHVGSRVLEFKPKKVCFDRGRFLKFVKQAFIQRRKKLSSNLKPIFEKAAIQEAFTKMNLTDDCRAQELKPDAFIKLFELLKPTD